MPRATYPSWEMLIIPASGDSHGLRNGFSHRRERAPFVLPAWHRRPEVEDQRRGHTTVPALQCGLADTFVDLRMSPPCETYLGADELPSTSTSANPPTHAVTSGSARSRSSLPRSTLTSETGTGAAACVNAGSGLVSRMAPCSRIRGGGTATGTTSRPSFRTVRSGTPFEWVVPHVYRKTVATMLDQGGLSARIIADQLGHSRISMTLDVYMGVRVVDGSGRPHWRGCLPSTEPHDE